MDFITGLKNKNPHFTSIVRILKSWRNYKELELSSFSIELVVAYLIEAGRISNVSINQAIITFFEFLGNDDSVKVYFSEAIGSKTDNVPYIADPTNNENNTINMSNEEWKEVIDMAETAFETLSYAKNVQESGKTLELWKEIFGPNFNIQEKV